MKTLKIIFTFFVLLFLFCTPCLAAESENHAKSDYYAESFEASGAGELEAALDENTINLLGELGIDISDYESLKAPDFKNIIKVIFDCITKGIKTPLKALITSIGIILIFSLINVGLSTDKDFGGKKVFLTLILSAVLLSPLALLIDGTADILKGLSAFLTVFVPVLSAVLSALGYVSTAGGLATAVLGVSQFMSHFISLLLIPITKAVTCLGLCGGLTSLSGISRLCELIKNGILWCFGTASAIFLSVISLQTAVSVTADSTLVRTSKSVISGLIPVMGPLISESLSVAGGCLSVLKTGVGIYGVLALFLSVLPILVSLICWKGSVLCAEAVSELFGALETTDLFKAVDFCLSLLIGSVVFTLLIYIISFGVVLKSAVI